MIRRLLVCRSRSFDPYENLALEEALLSRVGEGELILYLWQNEGTVVIGRNQNPWKECRTALLAEEGGHLARRLSGGGAVFHDRGNLNFTFLMNEADYDLPRQLTVLEQACRSLGIPAQRSGRNDLLAEGRKFSGNAFYKHAGKAYHHGTLMLDVDLERVSRYLSPSKAKLAAKGVDSVRSRVVNLREFVPELTIDRLADALVDALMDVYAVAPAISRPDEAAGQGSGIKDQGSGKRGTDCHDQSADWSRNDRIGTSSAVGGGVLDAPPCSFCTRRSGEHCSPQIPRPPEAAAAESACRDGSQPSAASRPPQAAAAESACRDGSEPSAASGLPEAPALQICHSERSEESVPFPSVQTLGPDEFELSALRAKYASDAWLYGPKLPFTISVEDRFPWGGVELQLKVNEGVIQAAKLYTDAMDETLAPRLEAALTGCSFRLPELQARLAQSGLPADQAQSLLPLLEKAFD